MKRYFKETKRFLIYLFLQLLLAGINSLPLKTAYAFAGTLGKWTFHLFVKDRETALGNLRMAFAEKTEDELASIYLKSLESIGHSAVDVLRFKRFGAKGIAEMVEVVGLEHFDRAVQRGKGIVAVSGHISNFELVAAWFGQAGYKSAAVGRKIYDDRLNRLLIDNRESTNVRNIDSEAPVTDFLRILRDGYAVGVLIDQDSKRYRGEFVDFFGKPAYTPMGPILLARTAKAALIPIVIIRTAPTKYRMTVFEEVEFDHQAERSVDVKRALAQCTKILEGAIRDNPEQWVWMHKRWNTKPEDVPNY